jgi:hypothetical protein
MLPLVVNTFVLPLQVQGRHYGPDLWRQGAAAAWTGELVTEYCTQ